MTYTTVVTVSLRGLMVAYPDPVGVYLEGSGRKGENQRLNKSVPQYDEKAISETVHQAHNTNLMCKFGGSKTCGHIDDLLVRLVSREKGWSHVNGLAI